MQHWIEELPPAALAIVPPQPPQEARTAFESDPLPYKLYEQTFAVVDLQERPELTSSKLIAAFRDKDLAQEVADGLNQSARLDTTGELAGVEWTVLYQPEETKEIDF
jgi:hypothetical protein